jgi:putative heme-binding domain-containing protein
MRYTLLACRRALPLLALLVILLSLGPARSADTPGFTLQPGDHIALIGNTLADRMQHDGWLEAFLYSRFPKHDLTVRNLGFSGDELTLRLRSENFGSPDSWLTKTNTDVVFAFFGYNESFKGKSGLPAFKKDLENFIAHTLAQKYNGKSAPRLVLFSPIAHENLHDRNLPNGNENNVHLELYTEAMAEVAKAHKIPFVDLFTPTKKLYAAAKTPLTINGIHLTPDGNRQLAELIDGALFTDKPAGDRSAKALEALRQAILDKDFHWFERYRTTDGYSIYGGRSGLAFVGGQTNRVVAQREMEVLDIMTANRDKRIWAVAQGKEYTVDDTNTPPFIPVITNKPGPLPGGKHIFLDGEKAIEKMKLGTNIKVNLFASEKEFPELAKPVQMTWDTKGRLWVAVWPSYPHWKPKEEMNDKILILEDTDGDGKADKCTVFADHLHNPTGFEFVPGGVLVAQAPDVVLLQDTKGTGKADVRKRVLHGIDSADTHHTANSFVRDPGGAIYFQEGTFHHTSVETPYGPVVRCVNAGVYRYEPRAQKFSVYVTHGFANPHGHAFDRWGQDIIVDGTGANPYHAALFSGHLDYPQKHGHPPQVYDTRGIRPCPGIEFLSSRHFPSDKQGNLLVANVIGFQGIRQVKIKDDGSSFTGVDAEPILSSTDPNFRPSDLKIGPDGALYFLDWQNPIIGHMQHNLRDPSRDREHGRIYRVTRTDLPLEKPVTIAGEPLAKLFDLLKNSDDRVRYRVRIELGDRPTEATMAALAQWVAGLNKSDPEYEHHLLEALWVHQSHNVVNISLLDQLLNAKDFRARAAATRVLSYWHDRVPDALDRLRKLAADESPRVRLEAVRAASFFAEPEALEVLPIAAELPSDRYLDFVRGETMKALDPIIKKAAAEGHKPKFTTVAGQRYFLKSVSTDDLLKLERTPGVYFELLFRKGVRDEFRKESLTGLAKMEKKEELPVLLRAIGEYDSLKETADESVAYDLARLLTAHPAAELKSAHAELVKLATTAKQPVNRQLGFVALAAADGNVEGVWKLGTGSVRSLQDVVLAVPFLRDPAQRAELYPRVAALLNGLPRELTTGGKNSKLALGRYVRIELPGKSRTLTLAEVEVYSDGVNVARRGTASQKNTAHGGVATRAIDGNTNPSFGAGGQTHTEENTPDPWWEVDLGDEVTIEKVVIYNRTDGDLSERLKGYALQVLDGSRNVVFRKDSNPTPHPKAEFDIGSSSPERAIRLAAMQALPAMRGQETEAVKALAKVVRADAKENGERHAAVRALERIPARLWPVDEVKPVLTDLINRVKKVPVRDRTTAPIVDALQLADGLTAVLPAEEARTARKELSELGVRVVRIGTVVERMIYDRERIVLQAGKPVEIVFENTDTMPHNLVFLKPGALEEVGTLAETTAQQPGALERDYVPVTDKILLKSKLVQPRQSQRLTYPAPTAVGVYPYVCTYPGHWRRMHGALYVVDDLDGYLTDPEGYLAKAKLPVKDELLKNNRPIKEWKLSDLSDATKELTGRSFASGKQMFGVATCISCHKLGGAGQEFGPDLTKLDPKWGPTDVLQHVLEPSLKIDEKYRSYTFELVSGKIITGMIVKETGNEVQVIENPLASTKPTTLKKADIEKRTESKVSLMPKGLLDRLTREEVLDLLAYVVSGGNEKHKAFQGGHEGHHH